MEKDHGREVNIVEKELRSILKQGLLHTLSEVSPLPYKVTFFTTGVNLTIEGSEVLEDLRTLKEKGAEILVCGTCLEYLDLKEKVAVGKVSNKDTIVETMLSAGHLVTV